MSTSQRPFDELARRLGLTTVGYRAEGSAFGTTITLLDTRAADRTPSVAISCPLVRPMDLRLTIATGSAIPPAKTEERHALGDPARDAWIAVWGAGEVPRASALLDVDLTTAMRAFEGRAGLKIVDSILTAFVDASASADAQAEIATELVALRGIIHASTRLVPAAERFSKALPAFQRFASELGVEATTCPFGLFGVVDGCAVDAFRFLPGAKTDDIMLVHVGFPSPLRGGAEEDWLLNSHLGRSLRARLTTLAETLWAIGPKPGWFDFGVRFKVARGSVERVHGALGRLDSIAGLAKKDRAFVNVTPERIITGVRLRDMSSPPNLAVIVRDLVSAAREVHGAAPPAGDESGGAPYR